jgi:hypothetical protein
MERELVEEWSRLLARRRFGFRPADVAEAVVRNRSILAAGATEKQIVEAEARLGRRLPPSYRRFLRLSNGAYGGHLGLQSEFSSGELAEAEPPAPRSLLPVEEIGLLAFDDPLSVDDVVPYQAPVQLGQSTLHHPTRGDEVSYLVAPWSGAQVSGKRGHAVWSVRIGWVDDPASVLLLNPMVMDGAGEWELVVLQPDDDYRYPSFLTWLEREVEHLRRRQPSMARARERLAEVSPSAPAGIGAAEALIGAEADPGWLVERLEAALSPGVKTVFQEAALRLVEWVDIEYGGNRFAAWVNRMLDDPLYDGVGLAGLVAGSRLGGVPPAAEVLGRGRSGDTPAIGSLPTADLVAAYQAAPDPILASYLEQRAHPLVVEPARVELQALIPQHRGYFRAQTRSEVHHLTGGLTSRQILTLADRHQLPPWSVARGLVRAGFAGEAVGYLERRLAHSGDVDLLYTIAEIDTAPAWEALDRAARSPERRTRLVSLQAAARTRSPLLAPTAAGLIGGAEAESMTALLALEIQPVQEAGDALFEVWQGTSHLGSLRALARRRDHRVLDDCRLLLSDDDESIARVGAETLRDLRHPAAKDAVLAALERARSDDLVAILAHTVTMLHATGAAPALLARAGAAANQQLADLLSRWARQLAGKASDN